MGGGARLEAERVEPGKEAFRGFWHSARSIGGAWLF
jgi:hypothetical protein